VDLDLSPDQDLFVKTTRRFLQSASPLTHVRDLHERGVSFERDYWRKGAELGWTAMLVPRAMGGGSVSGDGLLDLALVAEEMGRLVAPGPLLPVNVVLDTLVRTGSAARWDHVVAPLMAGDAVATWAIDEGSGSWEAPGVHLQARKDGTDWVLNGTKSFVQEADDADWLLVTARTGTGLTQFLVPRSTEGVAASPRRSIDLVRRFGDVSFTQARLPASSVVGAVEGAADDVQRQLEVALVLQNAETMGAVDRVLAFTLEYADDRIAFGRPIASYQALKHRFADMKTWLEACHGTATASARAVATGADNAAELVSVATSYIADRAPLIVQDCVQVHGGIGVTWEHDLHLYLRRVTQNTMLLGSARQHRERLAVLLGM